LALVALFTQMEATACFLQSLLSGVAREVLMPLTCPQLVVRVVVPVSAELARQGHRGKDLLVEMRVQTLRVAAVAVRARLVSLV
jgi:hypothetical protein